MLSLERHEQLLAFLSKHKSIRVTEASKLLHVTEKTIRLDLEVLEEKSLVKRVHGGAVLAETDTSLMPIEKRQESHWDKKREIAEKAKEMLEENDVILLDGGSTAVALAEAIGDLTLTVITNDIQVAAALYKKETIQLVMLGGARMGVSSALYSKETTQMLDGFFVKKVFIGATGVSLKKGLSVLNSFHIDWKKKAIKSGEKVILLADSTKFGQTGLMKFADLTNVDLIITDSSLSTEWKTEISASGMKIF